MSPEPPRSVAPSIFAAVSLVALLGLACLSGTAYGQESATEPPGILPLGEITGPLEALNEGNRLFRNGQLDDALEAYRSGYRPKTPHPTLVYNLATTLHHLDRLPEAILWYRRGASSEDPWLEENLWLARRGLGSQILPPGGLSGHLAHLSPILRGSAIALAWLSLLGCLAWRSMPLWILPTAASLAILLYACAFGVERWGPRPAVLLTDCSTAAGDLPAGTEAWVTPVVNGSWKISGVEGASCSGESLELVFPRG